MTDLERGILIGAVVGVLSLGLSVIIAVMITGGNIWIHF